MPPILVPSTAKRINTNFSNSKIKWKKIFYFERLCLCYHPFLQGTTYSKLATEEGMKIVQDLE